MALDVDDRPLQGEFLRTAKTINKMVDQLGSFASEVTRVAREVGTEGKLGGQADVRGVAGTWKDLTDSVNSMAGNLTGQVRNIAEVTTAVANGDLSKKITVDVKGEFLELKNTINTMVDQCVLVRAGSDARGPRGGHRRQTWRPGSGRRRFWNVEGFDRLRQLDGRQPHGPSAAHRRGHDGRRQRQLVEEDHRRCEGRNPRTEEHHQHDGRSTLLLRRRSNTRSPRSRDGRHPRRPSRRARRSRDVEGFDRLRQLDGRQFDRASATSPK